MLCGAVVVADSGASLLTGAGVSTGSVVALVPEVVGSGLVLAAGVGRLGLRKSPPSFNVGDFLPSPSVPSASETTSFFFSFFVPRLLKNDVRRAGFVVSGLTGELTAAVDDSFVAAAGSVAVPVAAGVVELTGSSAWVAAGEVTAVSLSLPVAVVTSAAVGLVASFLLKKLPKIEALLLAFGAASRGAVAAAVSVVESTGVSPATAVVGSVVLAGAGIDSPSFASGAPTTRDAIEVSRHTVKGVRVEPYRYLQHPLVQRWLRSA